MTSKDLNLYLKIQNQGFEVGGPNFYYIQFLSDDWSGNTFTFTEPVWIKIIEKQEDNIWSPPFINVEISFTTHKLYNLQFAISANEIPIPLSLTLCTVSCSPLS
jgi:hypothetical protein